jgi:sugar lactone lactonase YvrE
MLPGGAIANRRVLVSLRDAPFHPDSLAVDSEGFIWSVCWDGARILEFGHITLVKTRTAKVRPRTFPLLPGCFGRGVCL